MSDYAYGFQQISLPDPDDFGLALTRALDDIKANGQDLVNLDTQVILLQPKGDLAPRPYWIAMIVFGSRSPGTVTSQNYIDAEDDD